MDYTVPVTEDNVEAAARSRLYRLFAELFVYPGESLFQRLSSEAMSGHLADLASDLPYRLDVRLAAGALSACEDLGELQRRHTQLFMIETKGRNISLSEKDYLKEERDVIWEELIRFYEHFGVRYEYAADKSREFPDHLTVQLEFMHYLTYVESDNPESEAINIRQAEFDFLGRHMLKWVPSLAQALGGADMGEPYAGLAALLGAFLAKDAEYLAVRAGGHDQQEETRQWRDTN